MKKRRIQWISGIYVVLVLLLILFRPVLLIFPVADKPYIPLGNILIWVGYICLALFFFISSKGLNPPGHPLLNGIRKAFLFTILLAFLWAPVLFLLSGNFAGNFQSQDAFRGGPKASRVYWILNYALVLLPISLWVIQRIFMFFQGKAKPPENT